MHIRRCKISDPRLVQRPKHTHLSSRTHPPGSIGNRQAPPVPFLTEGSSLLLRLAGVFLCTRTSSGQTRLSSNGQTSCSGTKAPDGVSWRRATGRQVSCCHTGERDGYLQLRVGRWRDERWSDGGEKYMFQLRAVSREVYGRSAVSFLALKPALHSTAQQYKASPCIPPLSSSFLYRWPTRSAPSAKRRTHPEATPPFLSRSEISSPGSTRAPADMEYATPDNAAG